MVPALKEAHRLLRPRGTLIDIHPVLGTAGCRFTAPVRSSSPSLRPRPPKRACSTQTRRSLTSLRAACLSQSVRGSFDFRIYGLSGDELRDLLAEADAHSNQACEEACDAFTSALSARVDRIMAGKGSWGKSPATNGRGLLGRDR